MSLRTATLAVAATAIFALLPAATGRAAEPPQADEITRTLLKDPEFELIAISPDGSKLAISRQVEGDKAMVSVHNRADMAPVMAFDPGARGQITHLRWIDDGRLLVGATRLGGPEGFAIFRPVMVIATLDGKPAQELPWDFAGLVRGDPEHLLVHDCGFGPGNKGCNLPQIRKEKFGKQSKKGELLIEGPPDTGLTVNETASTGFALKWEEDGTSRTYVYKPADKTWTLLNDGSVKNLDVIPLGVTRDGKTGYIQVERKEGPDAIEKYDFATGTRTVLGLDEHSDPISSFFSFDGNELVGSRFEPTDPKARFWAPEHPDAVLYAQLFAAFPGRQVYVDSRSEDANWLVLHVSSDRDPGTWYLFDRKSRKAAPIARRFPWLEPTKQAGQTAFEFKARDGTLLHGQLTLPPNSAGKNLPLVVNPHGGPFWVNDVRGFDPELQILAQHGYAVLQVNFRGSSGYGRPFLDAGAKQWGRAMQDDVTDATKWAIAQGIADPARVCIFGTSYGGYAALMGPIREPGLYKCAASLAGPTDLSRIITWGSSRHKELNKKWRIKYIGDGDELVSNSPALNAYKFKVPALIANGYRDARVNVRHAQTMRKELEDHGVPVDYVEYSDTGHFLLLERHRLDFYARLLKLLDSTIGRGAKPTAAVSGAR